MNINTDTMVPISVANQNFSKVARLVDQFGSAVILKNNAPRYIIYEFNQADAMQAAADDDVMKVLTKRQILLLHSALIRQSGGSDGIRDEGLLDSAVSTPFQTFADQELYPSLLEKAARLGFGLICNHPFIDGNKRIGTHAMLVFLDINQITLSYEDDDLIETILRVASGTLDYNGLLGWLQEHLE